jgi:F-type H+-transporting ATPase subunit delta
MFAKEKNVLTDVFQDFQLIKESLQPLPEFKTFIISPIVKPEDKKKIFNDVFKGKINQITLDFLIFIVEKNRENALMSIIRMFEKFYRQHFNIKEVIIRTALPLGEDAKEKIADLVAEKYDCKAEIVNQIDEKIIGGFTIIMENQQLDLSVKTQLEEIKKTLKSEAYKIGL